MKNRKHKNISDIEKKSLQRAKEAIEGGELVEKAISMLADSLRQYFSKDLVYSSIHGFVYPIMEEPDMEEFCNEYSEAMKNVIFSNQVHSLSFHNQAIKFCAKDVILQDHFRSTKGRVLPMLISHMNQHKDLIVDHVLEAVPVIDALKLMGENPRYRMFVKKYIEYAENTERIRGMMLKEIPDNYIDLFPLARQMKRKFILHIGDTNSGKTYTSMQAMKNADSGIYLGPLRLLAFEQYEKLNKEGCLCTLKTGEEKKEVPGAMHISSTIEMLDMTQHYDVAVIDEAQLISDSFRGGAWTNAMLGILADEIHICAAPEAEKLIISIIESCGDSYAVERHERNTPLIKEKQRFSFEHGIKKGDALIVFSKKNVHAVANDLKSIGISSSIIYGALPYDVRQAEAKKFTDGITDVVVSTDAIGLGLNLPIQRVVFLETSKFDGKETRSLTGQEIKQIAGRAGRFGIFNKGYVNAYENRDLIFSGMSEKAKDLNTAYLRFPEHLISVEGTLSSIFEQWQRMDSIPGYLKADISHEMKLCQIAEQYTDDKSMIYDFITIPFDDESPLLGLWTEMLIAKSKGVHLSLHKISPLAYADASTMDLHSLEEAYKKCDLIFYYNEKFEDSIESAYVMEEKEIISKAIMELLDKKAIPNKKCRICGKSLKWNFRYGICEQCHQHTYRR